MKVHNPNKLPTAPISDLLPSQGDLKDLTEKNYKKLKNTIERRGFSVPVYVWEDKQGVKHLLDGHQRQRVLTTEGWNEPIPYLLVPAENLQEAMARLLEITSQYATITQEGIDEFIAKYELNEAEIYEATSFDALTNYANNEQEQEVEEDEAPEVDESEPPKSKLGEIYQLGRHRVMCGDSTDRANTLDLLDEKRINLVFTDPPYGIEIVGKNGKVGAENVAKNQVYSEVIGDDTTDTAKHFYDVIKDISDEQIIWGGNYFTDFLPFSPSWIIWDKRGDMTSNNFADGEMAWCSFKTRVRIFKQIWNGMIREGESEKRVHPTQKPIKTLADILKEFSSKGNIIYDGFLGSGSTLIACEQTDRICYGMELDPKYVDVIRKRYAKFTQPDDQLPENWEELTPAINSVDKA